MSDSPDHGEKSQKEEVFTGDIHVGTIDHSSLDLSKFPPKFQEYYRNQGLTDKELKKLIEFYKEVELDDDFKTSDGMDIYNAIWEEYPYIYALEKIVETWKFLFKHPRSISDHYKDSFIEQVEESPENYMTGEILAVERIQKARKLGFRKFEPDMDIISGNETIRKGIERLKAKHLVIPSTIQNSVWKMLCRIFK